jgi:HK97 family phage prohead protease
MPMKPHKGESKDDFMGRCVPELMGANGGTKRPQDQAVAACESIWRAHDKAAKADDKPKDEPYGDVQYADPGYQSDGKKRYPIDTPEHIRAAWSYINKAKNQEPYTAAQVEKIKGRIIAAWKKHIDPKGPPEAQKQGAKVTTAIAREDKLLGQGGDEGDDPEIEPEDGEDYSDWMDRCTLQSDSEECQEIWDDCMGHDDGSSEADSAEVPLRKTVARAATSKNNLEFILSDETVDRYGDIIVANGWDLKDFRNNPIALFNHNSDFPIGKWSNLRVEKGELRGNLQLADAGSSTRIDELRALIDQGILRAVSVGFAPIAREAIKDDKDRMTGIKFTKSELLECSLVSVPANANALAVARSLKVSEETKRLVFGKSADKRPAARSVQGVTRGKIADITLKSKDQTAMTVPISKRIEDAQTRLNDLQDQLNAHLATFDQDGVDMDAATITTDEINAAIDKQQKMLDSLKAAEQRLAATAQPVVVQRGDNRQTVTPQRTPVWAAPAKKLRPADHIFRSLTVAVKHFAEGKTRTLDEVLKSTYGDQFEAEQTRAIIGAMVQRSTSNPADMTTSGWASELVTTAYTDFLEVLVPNAVYPKLSAKGGRFTFGRNGMVTIPYREASPTIAGGFVAQASAIPVKQGSFNALTLTPKKLGVISTFTRELAEHSTPAIEELIRQAVIDDTSVAVDTVLLDNNAATATRPAGIRSGVSTSTASVASANLDKFTQDVRTLINVLNASSFGNLRAPVFIMSPGDILTAATLSTTTGDLPYREEIAGGSIFGVPIISSTNTPSDMMIIVDAADFVSATGDTPNFAVSDHATLHMEDTSPTNIVVGGSAATGVVRSMWQTDSFAIRMITDMNWALRRTGMVAWLTPGWN